MTLILGVEDPVNERAYIFCDSGTWSGELRMELRPERKKAWRAGNFVIGATGLASDCQLARRHPPNDIAADVPDLAVEAHLAEWGLQILKLAAEEREVTAAFGVKDPEDCPPQFTVALGSRIWWIHETAVTRTTSGFACAHPCAYGAMAALATISSMTSFARAERTAALMSRLSDSVHGTIHWLATDGSDGSLGVIEST